MEPRLAVLLVEDDPVDAQLAVDVLAAAGLDVRADRVDLPTSYAEALSRNDYAAILSDFRLPAFDGMTALAMARETRPDVPFILVSGALGEEAAVEFPPMRRRGLRAEAAPLPSSASTTARAQGGGGPGEGARRLKTRSRLSEERYRGLVETAFDWGVGAGCGGSLHLLESSRVRSIGLPAGRDPGAQAVRVHVGARS